MKEDLCCDSFGAADVEHDVKGDFVVEVYEQFAINAHSKAHRSVNVIDVIGIAVGSLDGESDALLAVASGLAAARGDVVSLGVANDTKLTASLQQWRCDLDLGVGALQGQPY
jgi:hypothetical protein